MARPEIDRADPPRHGDERTQLDAWLNFHRNTLLIKCAGLSAQQLKMRAAEPSSLSLLGLVRHMADSERYWSFRFASDTMGGLRKRTGN